MTRNELVYLSSQYQNRSDKRLKNPLKKSFYCHCILNSGLSSAQTISTRYPSQENFLLYIPPFPGLKCLSYIFVNFVIESPFFVFFHYTLIWQKNRKIIYRSNSSSSITGSSWWATTVSNSSIVFLSGRKSSTHISSIVW